MSGTGGKRVSRLEGNCGDYRAATGIFSHIPVTRKASVHAGFGRFQALATGITGISLLLLREKRKEEEEKRERPAQFPVIPEMRLARASEASIHTGFQAMCRYRHTSILPCSWAVKPAKRLVEPA